MRALDFGSGPFANYTVVQVHKSDASDMNAFVSVAFPGMVGVITGVSQRGIGVSEKVWETYDKRGIQPGSYNGEADVFVLRDILEKTTSRKDAETYLQHANRTWAIWIGIGDYETQVLDMVGYQQGQSIAYTDVTTPTMTGMPYFENLAYVDKHPQPSRGDDSLPTALKDFYGNIDLESSKVITQYHKTGDLHIASYDFTAGQMYLSIGKINGHGDYTDATGADTKAYNRPYLKFDLADLWVVAK